MGKYDYLKLPNQGCIATNLRLLYEMSISSGYADDYGYFTKRDVAEIGANALLITTSSRIGSDVIDTLNQGDDEGYNAGLQNAKMRMQILRLLGLISTDYDSEFYTITELGNLINPSNPNKELLLELFMNINTTTEVYEHNCEVSFSCYPGYQICYALASLDYKLTSIEMPVLMTYDIKDVKQFVNDAKLYRKQGVPFCKDNEHFPRTSRGTVLGQPSNITRTSNQILRYCGIIETKQKRFGKENYYTCTKYGRKYVDNIKKLIDREKLSFLYSYQFRKQNITKQKSLCKSGIDDLLIRSGLNQELEDSNIVFSPYQMIPECNIQWLLDKKIRNHPQKKEAQIVAINSEIELSSLRLNAIYKTSLEELKNLSSDEELLIQRILNAKESNEDIDAFIDLLCEEHKADDKTSFYPFVHSLLRVIGLDCQGEIGRYDAYSKYNGHIIPAEIKSYTETPTYNLKGLRQAIENKICSYNATLSDDLVFPSLVIGFNHPQNDSDIRTLINAAHEQFKINIIASDIRSLVKMAVNREWYQRAVDLDILLKGYGIIIS